MRSYGLNTLMRFHNNSNERRVSYRPFGGKIPTRLSIKILLQNYATGRNTVRWSYDGKYSWSAIQAARRIRRKLKAAIPLDDGHHNIFARVYEYHKGGLLYYGSLLEGTAFYGYDQAHYQGENAPIIQIRMAMPLPTEEEITCEGVYFPYTTFTKDMTALKIHKMILRNRRRCEAR